jgi:hypothetical protein
MLITYCYTTIDYLHYYVPEFARNIALFILGTTSGFDLKGGVVEQANYQDAIYKVVRAK